MDITKIINSRHFSFALLTTNVQFIYNVSLPHGNMDIMKFSYFNETASALLVYLVKLTLLAVIILYGVFDFGYGDHNPLHWEQRGIYFFGLVFVTFFLLIVIYIYLAIKNSNVDHFISKKFDLCLYRDKLYFDSISTLY